MPSILLNNGQLKTITSIPGWAQELHDGATRERKDAVGAYLASAWVMRAVEICANAISTPELCLWDADGEKIESHPALELLYNVNAEWNKSDLWRYTESGLRVYGSGYWQKVRRGGRVSELFYLNPSTIETKANSNGIYEFTQRINGKATDKFMREDVVYFRGAYDPRSDLTGLAHVQWAINAALAEANADKYLSSFFANSAVPAIIFSTDEPVGEPDRNRFLEWIRELFGGVTKAFKSGVLGGGMKPYPLSGTVRDMELEKVRAIVHQTISTALGVPELLISPSGANDLTPVKAAEAYFWRHNVIPRLSWYAETLNAELLTEYKDLTDNGAYFEFDLDDIPALHEDANSKSERVLAHLAAGLIKKEVAAAELGYSPEDMPEKETATAPAQLTSQKPAPIVEDDEETDSQKALAALDLERWQSKAIKALDKGKLAAVAFSSNYIPAHEHARITKALAAARTADDVRLVFSGKIESDPLTAAVLELRRYNDRASE